MFARTALHAKGRWHEESNYKDGLVRKYVVKSIKAAEKGSIV